MSSKTDRRKMHRKDPLKGRVPKDLDGAFRIRGRLDKLTEADLRAVLKSEEKPNE